jgi:release factor glutamine methyltransferase
MPPDSEAQVLRAIASRLEAAGCETAKLDARLILEHATGLSRSDLIARPETPVTQQHLQLLEAMVARREAGEPVSRILGEREFYGRKFEVTPAVLDPRPDTETLVNAALQLLAGLEAPRILDIGTGSGAIIVTLLAEVPSAVGVATDHSREALAVAARNAHLNGVAGRLKLVEADWATGIDGLFDLVVSNPPYIRQADIAGLSREVREHDPHLALSGGTDGLEAYRSLLPQAASLLASGGHVIVEFGAGQHDAVAALASGCGLALVADGFVSDLGGHVRCAVFARS